MSESTKLDIASDSASTASLKEANEKRIVRDEGEMAAAGDLEAAMERSMDEKENEKEGEVDPYLVTWKDADDPENPLNFRMRKKVSVIVMIAAIAFLTYLSFFLLKETRDNISDQLVQQCFLPQFP